MGFLSPEKMVAGRIETLFGSVFENDYGSCGAQSKTRGDFKTEPVFCGLDEAGRGPWAGPVVACALVFRGKNVRLPGVKDSKQLSAEKREIMYQKIARIAHFGVGRAEAAEIDRLGLISATKTAYERALIQLISNMEKETAVKKNYPLFLLIDGRDKFNLPYPALSIIKGDEKVKIIACASIMAKVERDRIMREMAGLYPGYGFELHKGYGTAAHQKALYGLGVCAEHRKSYLPVRKYIVG